MQDEVQEERAFVQYREERSTCDGEGSVGDSSYFCYFHSLYYRDHEDGFSRHFGGRDSHPLLEEVAHIRQGEGES